MDSSPRILVVAATPGELVNADGWLAVACGVGPVEAAAATSEAIVKHQPAAVLHVGIAGARRMAALAPATIVIGGSSCYCDADESSRWVTRVVQPPTSMLSIATQALPTAPVVCIGTSARMGGTLMRSIIASFTPSGAHTASDGAASDCMVEAMEGFAVLRAAERLGVPAIEVRAISNEIEETDRARWHFAAAFDAIKAVTPTLVHAMMADAALRSSPDA